jgi:hypothetical protein
MPGNNNSIYVAKRASALSNPTSATVFKQNDSSSLAAYVRIPEQSSIARFRVRAWGRNAAGAAGNFKATIQFTSDVTSTSCATAANNTDAVALTNRDPGSAVTRAWLIEADLIWDSTSQRLTGQKNGLNSETIETANAAVTALTSIDLSTGKCGFVVSALYGTSNASNSATLDGFTLEVL